MRYYLKTQRPCLIVRSFLIYINMENFIDKAIEWLEDLKKNEAIVENVSVTYGYSKIINENGFNETEFDGQFEMNISGRNLKKASD